MGTLNRIRIISGPYALIIACVVGLHVAVQIGSMVAAYLTGNPQRWMLTYYLVLTPATFAIAVPALHHRRRRTRFIREHNGHVCTTCGYLLTPDLDHKPCPECGTPIDLAHFRTQWIQHLGGWKQFPPP